MHGCAKKKAKSTTKVVTPVHFCQKRLFSKLFSVLISVNESLALNIILFWSADFRGPTSDHQVTVSASFTIYMLELQIHAMCSIRTWILAFGAANKNLLLVLLFSVKLKGNPASNLAPPFAWKTRGAFATWKRANGLLMFNSYSMLNVLPSKRVRCTSLLEKSCSWSHRTWDYCMFVVLCNFWCWRRGSYTSSWSCTHINGRTSKQI